MARRGNKPLQKRESVADAVQFHCMRCNKLINVNDLYSSDSELHASVCRIPYCRECLDDLYQNFLKQYEKMEFDKKKYRSIERLVIERICMAVDLYYNDQIFDAAVKESRSKPDATLMSLYLKQSKLYQYRKKNYTTTIEDRFKAERNRKNATETYHEEQDERMADIEAAIKIFGSGFDDDDYLYLYEQYADWTTRHECETKAQEEVFKRICFKQLEILKATRRGDDTKDLDMVFQKLLETAKLQPKQNKGETVSDAQTFGTLIDKWENTRPIPETEEELKDVDKIGFLIHVFYTGHMAKVLNLPSSLSNLYEKYIKKYTVEKQEYSGESDNEVLFDKIFGKKNADE